jgi:hypothetical protein
VEPSEEDTMFGRRKCIFNQDLPEEPNLSLLDFLTIS